MTQQQTELLDLDNITNAVVFAFKFKGETHELVEPSVDDFVKTLKEVEGMALNMTPSEEVEMSVRMIKRTFPSIKEKDLRSLKLSQLRKISDFARKASGQDVETSAPAEASTEVGNEPTAG